MMMRQWFKERVSIFLVACFLFATISSSIWYVTFSKTPQLIYAFNYDRDAQEILNIFDVDWYWLVAQSRDEYSPDFMLKYQAPQSNRMYAGRMKIYVLREEGDFVGFVAFYMKTAESGFLNFVDVKNKYRGKGYAQQLVRYALDEMKKMGAHTVSLITRPSNTSARALYTRIGFNELFNDGEFVGYAFTY
jgi:ribosomal protein S18 acetylase RimI-like enzyme